MNATETVKVKLMHRSSIANARWCQPVGWEPTNEIDNAEWVDGSWWSDAEEEAGLVCFVQGQGNEGDEIEVPLEDLRVVSTGDCRIVGEVKL